MWSLRPASNFIKNQKLTSGFLRLFHVREEMAIRCFDKKEMISRSSCSEFDKCLPLSKFGNSCSIIPPNSSMWKHTFSSQTSSKRSRDDDDMEDGFSDLDVPVKGSASNNTQMKNTRNVNVDGNGQAMSSKFLRLVSAKSTHPFDDVLNKWIEDGNKLSKEEISRTMFALHRLKRNQQALKLSWWLQNSNKVDFKESDYAIRVDLIAKLHGIEKAEKYIENIPKPFQGELIYRTLLSSSVSLSNVRKSEEIFNKMKDDLKFPLSTIACNHLLSLYLKCDKKKMDGVVSLMESQNLKPTLQTYKILLNSKGESKDISGMDQVYETMKSNGIKPDTATHILVARHYVTCGLKKKAEALLKEIEKDNIQNKRQVCYALFPLYASLSKPAEVKKLWNICEQRPSHGEILAAIRAWGVLKNVKEAEAIFNDILKRWKKATLNQYYALLKTYANNKECEKGKNLLKQMADNGIEINSWCWDRLVQMLLDAGEVEKADLALERAVSQTKTSPSLSTYEKIMSHYASRGDVHNCEKIFQKCKQLESKPGLLTSHFHLLVQAYVTSKTPAYGMRERLKVDNVLVSKVLAAQLEEIDAFKKTEVSDIFRDL